MNLVIVVLIKCLLLESTITSAFTFYLIFKDYLYYVCMCVCSVRGYTWLCMSRTKRGNQMPWLLSCQHLWRTLSSYVGTGILALASHVLLNTKLYV